MNYVLMRNIVMFARVQRLYDEAGGTTLRQERKQPKCRNSLSQVLLGNITPPFNYIEQLGLDFYYSVFYPYGLP